MSTTLLPSVALPAPAPPRRSRARAGAALLAGALLEVAFPPVGAWLLAPVGVAVLALCCRGARLREGARYGLLTGLALFVPLLHWTSPVAGPAPWIALAVAESLFLALLGAALTVVTRVPAWPVGVGLLWVGEEALRDRLPFGGFPWGRLAFSQGHTPFTGLAALGGAPLVTAAVGMVGGALALLLTRPGRAGWWALPGVVLLVAGPLVPTPTGGAPVRVAVVQGNVPRLGLDFDAQRSAVLRNHVSATLQLAADIRAGRTPRPDLVVWPENASDLDPYTDALAAGLIRSAVQAVGVPVLVGAVVDGPRPHTLLNRGVVWDPVTGPGASYDKQHPVPFGEYIPLRGLARRLTDKVDLVPQDFVGGDHTGVLQVGGVRVGDVICFEVAYDGLVRSAVTAGGRLLVVQTNNASYGRSGETTQQLAMSRLRAVEHGRTVLVAATSGVSAVIGPDGRLVRRSRVFTRDVLTATVPTRTGRTVATRLGGWPELVLALGALPLLVVGRRR